MKNLFTALFSMVLIPGIILANIIYVPTDQPTIQAGINVAISGDTVLVADSLYYENIDFKGKAITVASHFLIDGNTTHIDSTIIDGSNPSNPDSGSVVYFESGEDTTSILCGFTITGGSGTLSLLGNFMFRGGGGIYLAAGAKIEHNKIVNNSLVYSDSAYGGGIGAGPQQEINLVIRNNEIISNSMSATSVWGGGMFIMVMGQSRVDIIDNIISGNLIHANGGSTAGAGIAIQANGEPDILTIADNDVLNNQSTCTTNSAGNYGGGVHIWDAPVNFYNNKIINNDIVSDNTIVRGIGMRLRFSNNSHIYRNYISGNNYFGNKILSVYGGGIYISDANPIVQNNIIVENSASHGAGIGVYTEQGSTKSISGNAKVIYCDETKNCFESIQERKSSSLMAKPIISNNSIAHNKAITSGGSIYSKYSDPIIINSILWSDSSSAGTEIYGIGTVNIVYSVVKGGWQGNGNLNIDPLFVPDDSLYNLEHTTDTSRCLNSGIDSIEVSGMWYFAPQTDFGESLRPQPVGTPPDMGAWEYPVVSSLEKIKGLSFPKTFVLKQNYPNPFNPRTNIQFSIPKSEFITLKIYNLLGQEVATLVSENLKAGNYKYVWDAGTLASGVYIYKIQAGAFQEVRKMVYLK